MLLGQMDLLNTQLKLKEDKEKMEPLDFFLSAIETGWRKNPNRQAGDTMCWGPTVLEAYQIYYNKTERVADRDLADIMKTGRIAHVPAKRGYMLKIVRQD